MTFTTFNAVSIITDRFNNLSDSTICINPMTSLCFIYDNIFIICVHLAKLVRTFLNILVVGRFRAEMRIIVKPWPQTLAGELLKYISKNSQST